MLSPMKQHHNKHSEASRSPDKNTVMNRAMDWASSEHNNMMSKTDEPSVRYKTEDHIAVICQMYGSVWRNVLPYCIVTTAITVFAYYFDNDENFLNISISDRGHVFMSLMLSFFVVSRSHIALNRYSEARKLLSDIMRTCRELIQHTIAFTRNKGGAEAARKWRADIARRTCTILRTLVCLMQLPSKHQNIWELEELTKDEKQALLVAVGDSNERSPLVLMIFLRSVIASHVKNLKVPLDVNEELALLSHTADFITAYHQLMKLHDTPYPFPLLQMTRTFLLVWVFTLPFALAKDFDKLLPMIFTNFFCTYGFIGLELISVEMDDPFGEDPNDFDVHNLAKVVFFDIYYMIEDIDGTEAANALRNSFRSNSLKEKRRRRRGNRPGSSSAQSTMSCDTAGRINVSTAMTPSNRSRMTTPLRTQEEFIPDNRCQTPTEAIVPQMSHSTSTSNRGITSSYSMESNGSGGINSDTSFISDEELSPDSRNALVHYTNSIQDNEIDYRQSMGTSILEGLTEEDYGENNSKLYESLDDMDYDSNESDISYDKDERVEKLSASGNRITSGGKPMHRTDSWRRMSVGMSGGNVHSAFLNEVSSSNLKMKSRLPISPRVLDSGLGSPSSYSASYDDDDEEEDDSFESAHSQTSDNEISEIDTIPSGAASTITTRPEDKSWNGRTKPTPPPLPPSLKEPTIPQSTNTGFLSPYSNASSLTPQSYASYGSTYQGSGLHRDVFDFGSAATTPSTTSTTKKKPSSRAKASTERRRSVMFSDTNITHDIESLSASETSSYGPFTKTTLAKLVDDDDDDDDDKDDRRISVGTGGGNLSSNLFTYVRNRVDSEASFEIFASNERMKYDSASNTISKRRLNEPKKSDGDDEKK